MNREFIKWQPFNDVTSGSYMINEVLKDKYKVKKPILSDDQMNEIQKKIFEAFHNQETIKVKYFRDGRLYLREGKITNIDVNKHKITLNNTFWIFFSQIIEIY